MARSVYLPLYFNKEEKSLNITEILGRLKKALLAKTAPISKTNMLPFYILHTTHVLLSQEKKKGQPHTEFRFTVKVCPSMTNKYFLEKGEGKV